MFSLITFLLSLIAVVAVKFGTLSVLGRLHTSFIIAVKSRPLAILRRLHTSFIITVKFWSLTVLRRLRASAVSVSEALIAFLISYVGARSLPVRTLAVSRSVVFSRGRAATIIALSHG